MPWVKLSRFVVLVALTASTSECGGDSTSGSAALGGAAGVGTTSNLGGRANGMAGGAGAGPSGGAPGGGGTRNGPGGSAGASVAGIAGTADSQPPVCGVACTGTVNCPGLTSFTGTAYVSNGACVLELHANFGSGTKNVLSCDNQVAETDLGTDPGTGFSGTWSGSGSTVTLALPGATVTCNIAP